MSAQRPTGALYFVLRADGTVKNRVRSTPFATTSLPSAKRFALDDGDSVVMLDPAALTATAPLFIRRKVL